MFPVDHVGDSVASSFPRIRGDVPSGGTKILRCGRFSPHTRGCSLVVIPPLLNHVVFPAYAGMFRQRWPYHVSSASFPRIRGDVPNFIPACKPTQQFSPHTRGCSGDCLGSGFLSRVFPAYAGMFLAWWCLVFKSKCFPRIRGDVPLCVFQFRILKSFSPHTRGCSVLRMAIEAVIPVFPAYAGMFHDVKNFTLFSLSFPRIRGDVPASRH